MNDVLSWAIKHLELLNTSLIKHEKVIDTSYSKVYKLTTNQNIYYLKQTPETLFIEPKTIQHLRKFGCSHIPKFVAENKDLYCFLMESCGDQSLRHLFNGQIQMDMLKAGITNYTNIQRKVEQHTAELLNLGVFDWRIEKFSSLFVNLIQQEELLMSDGLSLEEIKQLNQAIGTCEALCEKLIETSIPETINHCDFHDNNMLIDKKTGKISIIDWGETVISHPFFSLNGCLWNLTYFQNITTQDNTYKEIQKHAIAPWLDSFDEDKLLEALTIANHLNGIFAALGYELMYQATIGLERTVQQEHPGSIAGCLRSFLNY